MMLAPRNLVALSAVIVASLVAPSLAPAHQGNPDFRSVVTGVRPAANGLQVRVLGFDDRLELTNRSGRTVVISGYEQEPYARVLADGTVQVNRNSPATYLNEDRYGKAQPPTGATASATPSWKTLDRVGTFQWHDHRAHWMGQGLPPKVKDQSKKTRIFDYQIPITVDGRPGAIDGTLLWVGSDEAGVPKAAIVAMGVVILAALTLVLVVRRRRKTR